MAALLGTLWAMRALRLVRPVVLFYAVRPLKARAMDILPALVPWPKVMALPIGYGYGANAPPSATSSATVGIRKLQFGGGGSAGTRCQPLGHSFTYG